MACTCTGGVMLVRGVPTCATCNKAISQLAAPAEVSSVRLPVDAKDVDAFNRACRTGRVTGARKMGRVWVATLDAWNARSRAEAPRGIAPRKNMKGGTVTPIRSNDDADVLAELGLGSRRAG